MKRREFIQSTAAAAAASVLPAAATAATAPAQGTAPPLDAEVTRVRIGTHRTGDLREANRLAREAGKPLRRPDPPDDEMNYWAEAIRIGDSYFYRVGDIVVPVHGVRVPDGDRQSEHVLLLVGAEAALPHPAQA